MAAGAEIIGNGVVTVATALFSDDLPPATLKSLVPKISGAVFFVYGEHGQPAESPPTPRSTRPPRAKQIWEVPGSGHIGGVDAQPRSTSDASSGSSTRTLPAESK